MATYELTALARQDLDDTYTYGIRQWGLRQADKYYDALIQQLDQIAEDPQRHPALDHIAPNVRRRVYGSHAIYYEPRPGGVLILSIIRSQDIARLK